MSSLVQAALGDERMTPLAKDEVISYIRGLQMTRPFKRLLLRDWARMVNARLSDDDFKRVQRPL